MSEYLLPSRHCSRGWRNGSKQGLLGSALLDLMNWWAQALVVSLDYKKFRRLGGPHSKYLFLIALEAGKPEVMVPAWLGSGEGPPSGLQTAAFLLCPQIAGRKRNELTPVSSNKGTNPIHESSTLTTKLPPKQPISKYHHMVWQFSSVQLLSRVWLFATPWIAARQASLSITNSRSSLRLTSIDSVMPSSHLILCHPLLLLPPIPPSIRVFSNESTLPMRWPKHWSFSFSIIPSKEIPGLISFRMDWLDLLAVQGTLKSLLQHHTSKASILQCSAFFTVQLSHPYIDLHNMNWEDTNI